MNKHQMASGITNNLKLVTKCRYSQKHTLNSTRELFSQHRQLPHCKRHRVRSYQNDRLKVTNENRRTNQNH